jgi:hypothetical protein
MDSLLYVVAGVGLSAACGFRVFVPFLVAGLAAQSGHLELSSGFEWIASWPAIALFGTATAVEVGAYYVPWIDNALDSIATPAAVVAGTLITASFIPETGMSPILEWTIAAITGGGAAGTVQASTVLLRGASTATTGGLGNPLVSTGELGGAVAVSILAIAVPILVVIVLAVFLFWAFRKIFRRRKQTQAAAQEAASAAPPALG